MNPRYDIRYDPKASIPLSENLKALGGEIIFNNTSVGRMIASLPSDKIERVRGLTEIIDINESPLPL